MSNAVYLAAWLLAALVAVGFLSAAIAKQLRFRELRQEQAALLVDALERYLDWLAAQRRAISFTGEAPEAAAALDTACQVRITWFPELAADMAEFLATHNRFMNFLTAQQALRLSDPEAWLETDHDARFVTLWRQQRFATQSMQARLGLVPTAAPAPESAVAASTVPAAPAWFATAQRSEEKA